jgi:hypothetical protein
MQVAEMIRPRRRNFLVAYVVMTTDGELWHFVEAKRDDGMPTMFNIREIEPRKALTKIFVVELPYPKTTPACLPSASDYRRHTSFDEQWLRPACTALGWELVGSKVEDGSFFFYMYGDSDPNGMIEKLSPFDAGLGFYDDDDPDWQEYSTLRDLLDQARRIPSQRSAAPAAAAAVASAAQPTQPIVRNSKSKSKAKKKPRAPKAAAPKPKSPPKKPATKKKSATKTTAAKRKRR